MVTSLHFQSLRIFLPSKSSLGHRSASKYGSVGQGWAWLLLVSCHSSKGLTKVVLIPLNHLNTTAWGGQAVLIRVPILQMKKLRLIKAGFEVRGLQWVPGITPKGSQTSSSLLLVGSWGECECVCVCVCVCACVCWRRGLGLGGPWPQAFWSFS